MLRSVFQWTAGAAAVFLLFGLGFGKIAYSSPDTPKDRPSPAASIQAKALNLEVETLYKLVEEGNLMKVNESLRKVQSLFEAASFQGLTSVEGIQVLAESIVEMKETTAGAQLEPKQWMRSAAKLRLAADSLTHPKDGIWLQYYKVIREDLRMMELSAAKQDTKGIKKAYASLEDHYELIRPALVIQRKPEDVSMIESWLSHAGGVVSTAGPSAVRGIIPQGEVIVNILFGKKKDEPALAQLGEVEGPWFWQLLFGAFILSALSFAAYRKYKGLNSGYHPMFPKKY
ncbi:sporulation protein YpjB [Paenibacillus dakarensis]|uniref:sporulation protein YpjB n=1 Tax=Paenibacillus dakarensis TaxID=1527293 RepID=UPI0006D56B76|nr:sporulation protein YpjB [Paenibacillus dakarensis]